MKLITPMTFFQVYWCGPLIGGSLAGLLYDKVYAANIVMGKATQYVLTENCEPCENSNNTDRRKKMEVGETEAYMSVNTSLA